MSADLSVHPLALLIPEMSDDQYADLRDDVAANGLLEPIVLHDDLILDGRHRYRACRETGAELRTREFDGDSPAGFVLSANVKRRHLSVSQRAALAVEFLRHLEEEAHQRKVQGAAEGGSKGGRGHAREIASVSKETQAMPNRASREAGALVGVSGPSVARAKRLKEHDPEAFEEVKAGVRTVTSAERELAQRLRATTPAVPPAPTAPTGPPVGRDLARAHAQQRRIEAVVGQCAAFNDGLGDFRFDLAARTANPGEVAGWLDTIKSGERALRDFRQKLTAYHHAITDGGTQHVA